MPLSFPQTFLSTAFLIAVGTFVLISCGAFIGYAVARQTLADKSKDYPKLPWLLFGVIAVWFGAALATSTAGLISFQLVVLYVSFPVSLGFLLSYTSPVKKILKEIPTHWLIILQFYRVAGGIFIYPFLTEGVLTRGFALNAGIGDILTALIAVPVAWLVKREGVRWKWLFYAWTALGILDLIVAMSSAAYFGFAAEGVTPNFPITMIPLFYGPPFGILIHLITVRNFNLRQTLEQT